MILSLHWGSNWGYETPAAHRSFAHRLIDRAGVDILHGHSSHHPRAMELYKNKLILYGAGDFVNDYEGIGGKEFFPGRPFPPVFSGAPPCLRKAAFDENGAYANQKFPPAASLSTGCGVASKYPEPNMQQVRHTAWFK